ncbi:MAG: hypothetical protein M0Z41_01340 [Peptococcaceae bacterium]|jgi:hypothetical protein|nr:hypothetical protein [Peptococcaceae bacterium]
MSLGLVESSSDIHTISTSLAGFAESFEETGRLLAKLGQDLTTADSEIYDIIQRSQGSIHVFDQKIADGSVVQADLRTC